MVRIDLMVGLSEFMATAEQESFSGAARHLDVSVAHISRQISALEKKLGVRLFHRTTRKVALTDEGRRYFQDCQPLVTELASAQDRVRNLRETLDGRIRISAGGGFAERYVASLVAQFCRQHPQVICEMVFTDRKVDLISEYFDLAVRSGALGDSPSIVGRPFISAPFITLVSPSFLKANPVGDSPKLLNPAHCLSFYDRPWQFRRKGKDVQLEPAGRLRTNNAEALVSAAIQGLGFIHVPAYYGAEARANKSLVAIFDDWRRPDGANFHLVYQKQSYQPKRLKMLVDFLIASAAKDAPKW